MRKKTLSGFSIVLPPLLVIPVMVQNRFNGRTLGTGGKVLPIPT